MQLELPVVSFSEKLEAALDLLRHQGVSALIATDSKKLALFTAAIIAVGRHRERQYLSQLTPLIGWSSSSGKFVLDIDVPEAEVPSRTSGLGRKFALPGSNFYDAARSASAHISSRNLLLTFAAPPKDYYCDGPSAHEFPDPPVTSGQDCPSLDGYIIVSAR